MIRFLKKLFIDYNFDFKIIKKALKFLDKNHERKTLLNVGANIGSICIKSVKEKLFNSAIVFEPAKKHFRLLVANIYLNDFHIENFHWPAFNFADSYITIGAFIYIFALFTSQNDNIA